jgi:hypothetical protein
MKTKARLWGVQDVAEYLGVPIKTLYQGGNRTTARRDAVWAAMCATTPMRLSIGSANWTI